MADNILNSGNLLQYNPLQTQSTVNTIFYLIAGLAAVGIVLYIVWKVKNNWSYNIKVSIDKKVGNAMINFEDKVKQIKMDEKYYYHYLGINKYSPVFDSSFLRIFQKQELFGKKTYLGFNAFIDGESIFPVKYIANDTLQPINLDLFNYLQSRVKHNHDKFTKMNLLMQYMPIIGVTAVIIVFFVGMIFYTKHVETIAKVIIDGATTAAAKTAVMVSDMATKSGAAQIIPNAK